MKKNTIKVCHFTSAHKENDTRIFQKECVSLSKAGYEVYIVAPNAKTKTSEGIHILGVPVNKSNPLYRLFFLSRKIYKKAIEINADIYHFHDIELFFYGLKLKKKGKKVIFDSHEDWPEYINDSILWLHPIIKRTLSTLIKKIYKKYLPFFDAVVTVTTHTVDKFNLYTDKVYMITNFPILPVEPKVIKEEEFILRSNRICYAGTVYVNSNQNTIIRTLEAIDNIEYVIVGTISSKLKNELSGLHGWNKVKFIDKVPREELSAIYDSSIAGLVILDYFPGIGYNKGSWGINKIFEYMSAGLPIICTDYELWKYELIDKYQCGFYVTPGSIEQVKKVLVELISDRKKAYLMGQNAQRAVYEKFNWGTQEKILLDMYKKITETIYCTVSTQIYDNLQK